MAVEKTQAAHAPFQPRLQPRPVAVRGFAQALAESLAQPEPPPQAADGQAEFVPPPAPLLLQAPMPSHLPGSPLPKPAPELAASAAQPESPTVTTRIRNNQVRTVIERKPPAPQCAAPDQFSEADEAALSAWGASLRAKPRAQRQNQDRPLSTGAKGVNEPPLSDPPSQVARAVSASPESLAETASAQLGKRYAAGGESPGRGFDCSGLTSYVYNQGGVELPRSSREQFRQGQPVNREDLRKGDLVFFGKKGVHHVGIYLEDGRFIHSASSGKSVKVSSLDEPVWKSQYAGARRLL
ncbi:C40 family peptidase [Fundidesulfovibrio agrisoli]|uniref:C40 family peptidase n=1 Tax=Fundidesulfovibrio agrisoli TaxID=2922717 RepID=UPI001FADF34C|nr:C40 family peptidase [Fundidesulfovibrio agrisoli]